MKFTSKWYVISIIILIINHLTAKYTIKPTISVYINSINVYAYYFEVLRRKINVTKM